MKKTTLIKTMLLLCALVAGSSSVWAADVTISFGSGVSCSDGVLSGYENDKGNITLTTAQNSSDNPAAISSSQLRLYGKSGGNGCSVSITSSTKWIHTVVFTFSGNTYAAASQGKYTYTSGTTGTWSGNAKSLTLKNTNDGTTQVRITKIEITYGDAPAVIPPVISEESGYIIKGTSVTISTETVGADIYYTEDGSAPTSASTPYTGAITVNNDVVIKAIAIKGSDKSDVVEAEYTVYTPAPGLAIDFEEAHFISYSDWEFNNIGRHTSGITAHGGSAWGTNINAAGNGVKTATITTKEKIAAPGTFTCYISRETTNNTTSNWKIQTSSDGSSWTDVASKSAVGMSQGAWQEFFADLTSYSNVYVRLSYSCTGTALRAVDDITLTLRPSVQVDNGDGTITLTTTDNMDGWRAFYDATQDYTLDANTKAYVAQAKSGTSGVVELTQLNATAIPHGEAVILKTSAGDHKMVLTKTTGAASLGDNLLAVTDGSNNVDGYRLGYGNIGGDDKVGFFKYTTTTAPAAGIVYIAASNVNNGAGARGLAIDFNDDVTAIEAVKAQNVVKGEYFNLAGQRVAQPTKGLYIVNGKKVVIK